MSLTKDDLQQIQILLQEWFETSGRQIVREEIDTIGRQIVREEIDTIGRRATREEIVSAIDTKIEPHFDSLEGRLEALDNDVKDIYKMISELQKLTRRVAHFEKYDLEQKVLAAYKEIVSLAEEANIKLPQS